MFKSSAPLSLISSTFLFILTTSTVHAQYSYSGGAYLQDFDSLASSGVEHTWKDNDTLTGWYFARTMPRSANAADNDWYLNRATYRASSGTDANVSLYSFGSDANDRALGTVASSNAGLLQYGLRLKNNTGSMLSHFSLSFFGEQWRVGETADNQSLKFAYSLGAASLTDGIYTNVSSLIFEAPQAGSAGARNGNLAANRRELSADIIGINWAPGTDLWLRWTDNQSGRSGHGTSIDNVRFVGVAAIPEPAFYQMSVLLLGGAGLVLHQKYRRR